MKSIAEEVRDIQLIDENREVFLEANRDKCFFCTAWVHYFQGKYYFSYKRIVLIPGLRWTNHHSIVEKNGTWCLFNHSV
jgi:hypothetical protein